MRRIPVRWRWIGRALLLALGLGHLPAADPEDELKSAVVLSFLRYSEWPDAGARGPVVVGVTGRHSLIPVLQKVLEERQVNHRAVRVKELIAPFDPHCCELIYVAASKPEEIRQLLAGLRGGHALTIGENDRFLEAGGMVNLSIVDGHISFEIDLKTVEHTGVQISSRLLRLGIIRGKRS